MSAYLDNLTTARDNASARLVEITASPKPSYDVNGQKFSWTEYHKMLVEMLREVNGLIAAGDVDGTPVEIVSQGYT